mgnify:CR=1 FL=1
MLGFLASLLALPVVIAVDLLSSSSGSTSSGEGNSGDGYPHNPDAYAGRWTENDIAIRDNINAGMAIKED